MSAKGQETVRLDAQGIDRLSELLADHLTQAEVERREVLRLRLALEDILGLWMRELGTGKGECTFRCVSRLGRQSLQVLLPGGRMDPAQAEEGLLFSSLLAQAGLNPVYSYHDGNNCLTLSLSRPRRLNPILQLVLAILAAVGCGAVCLLLPQPVQAAASGVVDPLFSTLMGILQTLAGPMIFLGVCWGIVNMGDVQVLGRIGKTVLTRFVVGVFLTIALTAAALVWFFLPENGVSAAGSGAAGHIYEMLLGIIPGNLLTPFTEGNSLQIIFLAICSGLVLLVLGEKTATVRSFIEQANIMVQFAMEVVSRYIALFVFVSIFSLMLSADLAGLGGVVKGLLLGIATCVVWPVLYALAAALRMKVSFSVVLHKLLPTYLVALSTDSSAAALGINLESCERRLGISPRLTGFGVPLGQVIYKIGAGVGFFVLALGLAEFYGVAMPLSWVVTGVLVSGLLAMAAPPVPGGSLTCYTVLLTQLGIPEEAIGLAVAGNVILGFFMTACGVSCLQSELVLAANKLGMLDRDCLARREVKGKTAVEAH